MAHQRPLQAVAPLSSTQSNPTESYLRGAAGGVAAVRVGVHDLEGEVVRHGGVAQVVGDLC